MIEQIFSLILKLSLQATIIGLIIFIIKLFLYKKLTAQFHFLIWSLVFIRLVMPVNISSDFSFFNYISINQSSNSILLPLSLSLKVNTPNKQNDKDYNLNTKNTDYSLEKQEQSITNFNFIKSSFIPYLWLYIMIILLVLLLWNYLNLKINIYKNQSVLINEKYEEVIIPSLSEFGVSSNTEVVFTSHVKSTFVFGFFKPLIVIPSDLLNYITIKEFKAILNHESMHLKLHHQKINMLAYIITIIYWFNPFIWLFLKLMRNDAEFYCDNSIMKTTDPIQETDYIDALLKTSKLKQTDFIPVLNFGQSNLRKRLSLIINRKSIPNYAVFLSISLSVVLSLILLTTPNKKENTTIITDTLNKETINLNSEVEKNPTVIYKNTNLPTEPVQNPEPIVSFFDKKNIDTLTINADFSLVRFEKSDNDNIEVRLEISEQVSPYYKLTNKIVDSNELDISLKNSSFYKGENLFYNHTNDVILIIKLPNNDFFKSSITLNSATLHMDSFKIKDFSLAAFSSIVSVKNSSFEKCTITSNSTDLEIDSLYVNDFSLSAFSNNILSIKNSEFENCSMTSNSTNLDIDSLKTNNFSLAAFSSTISFKNIDFTNCSIILNSTDLDIDSLKIKDFSLSAFSSTVWLKNNIFEKISLENNASTINLENNKIEKSIDMNNYSGTIVLKTEKINFDLNIQNNSSNTDIYITENVDNLKLNIESISTDVSLPNSWNYTKKSEIESENYKYAVGKEENIIYINNISSSVIIKN